MGLFTQPQIKRGRFFWLIFNLFGIVRFESCPPPPCGHLPLGEETKRGMARAMYGVYRADCNVRAVFETEWRR